MSEENVKVAVRVRPFNSREKDRSAQLIIGMQGQQTTIKDPNDSSDVKKFNFDFSYWSHDGCKDDGTGYFAPDPSHANGKRFADQKRVFDELGQGVLNNAWEGYNSTLFAYGQTGSGKSWSMVGYKPNVGIVPLYCDKLFTQIEEKKAAGGEQAYEVTFSMLEIYNEQVRDLLVSSASKSGLRVRQHPKKGFYADGAKDVPVGNYTDIEQRIEEGTRNRTVASTKMNATSSRAHTIVTISFIQKSKSAAGEEMSKTSEVNLVDLAGSERADSTGATGARLKEGAAINQSLSSLGNCIAALADRASGKQTRVPYRDSVLTKLLKNALGGNSKTIMIAALSPADINYDETLSTLRYADRAKQIKCSAKVNEDPTAALIRELQEENERLKAMLEGKPMEGMSVGDDDEDLTEEEKAEMKRDMNDDYEAMLKKNEEQMKNMEQEFEARLAEAQKSSGYNDIAELNEKRKRLPHLYNLNMDHMLTGKLGYIIDRDHEIIVGTEKGEGVDLVLRGGGIKPVHCKIWEKDGVFTMETFPDCRVLRNGKPITNDTKTLKHNDRLLFGSNHLYVFCNPAEAKTSNVPTPDFESAQAEIAQKAGGFDMSLQNKSKEDALLQNDLMDCMQGVEEANSISEALGMGKQFHLVVVSPEARGELTGRSEVMVKMTDVETKHEWMWPRAKFLDRKCIMVEMYNNYEDGEDWKLPKEKNPFEDEITDSLIGSVKMWPKSLSYMIETEEALEMTNYKGVSAGTLLIGLYPCDPKGKEYTEKDNMFVENPEELKGKPVTFKVKIINARGLPNKYTNVYCKYKIFNEEKMTETKPISGTANPDFKHERIVTLQGTDETIAFLSEGAFCVQVWGKQKDHKPKGDKTKKLSAGGAGLHVVNTNVKTFDAEKVKAMLELSALKKRQEKMQQKMDHMKKMIEVAEEHKKRKISTKLIKDIYYASNNVQAEKCIAFIPLEKDSDDEESGDARPVGVVPPQNKQDLTDKKSKHGKHKRRGSGHGSSSSSSSSSSSDSDSDSGKKAKLAPKKQKSPKSARSEKSYSSKQKSKSGTCVML